MLDKSEVKAALIAEMNCRVEQIERRLSDSRDSLLNETKSTAGDKHETGRAMIQLEQEKLGKQLQSALQLKTNAAQLPDEPHTKIQFGSLVQTKAGWFYLSIGIGKIDIAGTDVFCLSAATPLGQVLLNRKAGESYVMNGATSEIITVL